MLKFHLSFHIEHLNSKMLLDYTTNSSLYYEHYLDLLKY